MPVTFSFSARQEQMTSDDSDSKGNDVATHYRKTITGKIEIERKKMRVDVMRMP